jgi:dihydroorotate dehydrogenase
MLAVVKQHEYSFPGLGGEMAFTGEVGHLSDIESPWANAGGVVKSLEQVELMAHTGVGWIEAGSYTLMKRHGNAVVVDEKGEPVPDTDLLDDYYHDPKTGETFNSLGMPNKGMDVIEQEIPEMAKIAKAHNKALAVNVAPVSDNPADESIELVTRAYEAGAGAVVLNAGCPNVIVEGTERHELLSRNTETFGKVLLALATADLPSPIWVRISPQENLTNAYLIANQIRKSGIVSAVLTPNTWPGYKPVDEKGKPRLTVPGNIGGKSGPAMAQESQTQSAYMALALKDSGISVIRSSGIMNAQELKISLKHAVAAAGTTFFYESRNGWKEDTDRILYDLAS